MELKHTHQTLETLVPAMAKGFVVQTQLGKFLMRPGAELEAIIQAVRKTLVLREKTFKGKAAPDYIRHLNSYIDRLEHAAHGPNRGQLMYLRGFINALVLAGLMSTDDAEAYQALIDYSYQSAREAYAHRRDRAQANPFLTEGHDDALPDLSRPLAQ